MQLVEGIRWLNIVDERILAIVGKIAIYSQPVAGMIEIGRPDWILPYVLLQVGAELFAGSRELSFTVAEDGHYRWDWIDEASMVTLPYWIALFSIASILFPSYVNAALLGSLLYYGLRHWEYQTWGSLWCVSVNLLWIYYLLKS
jgi:hypothetical protein